MIFLDWDEAKGQLSNPNFDFCPKEDSRFDNISQKSDSIIFPYIYNQACYRS